nr:MAG TPA: hypothetical protein [Caudoviricetes sp.]
MCQTSFSRASSGLNSLLARIYKRALPLPPSSCCPLLIKKGRPTVMFLHI